MAKWNRDKKVLDHEHTRFWRHDLRDVDQPNLQKDIFPYDEVSRIDFDHKLIPINPADELVITTQHFAMVNRPVPLIRLNRLSICTR